MPPPDITYGPKESGPEPAELFWQRPGWGDKIPPSYVLLRRELELMGGRGEEIPVEIKGARGYLYEGEGDGGSHGILWDIGSTCNLISLELEMPDLGAEARQQIIKVAKSLRRDQG